MPARTTPWMKKDHIVSSVLPAQAIGSTSTALDIHVRIHSHDPPAVQVTVTSADRLMTKRRSGWLRWISRLSFATIFVVKLWS